MQQKDMDPVLSYEVFHHWPEWKAFAARLGIPLDLRSERITIEIGMPDELVKVTVRHQAVDTKEPIKPNRVRYDEPADEPVKTSSQHNKERETHAPNPLGS